MSPASTTAERRQAVIDLTGMSNEITSALIAGLKPALEALGDDKGSRHHTANMAQQAIDLSNENKTEIREIRLEISGLKRIADSLLGDGTGENGKLAIMGRDLQKTKDDISEVKSDVKLIKDSVAELKGIGEQSKTWMSGGKGVAVFFGLMVTLFTVIGGIVSALFWLFKH